MKKFITKEKTNKMYLLMLCGLLVSGAIVCSTNDNGNPLMFVCPNGTPASGTTTMANIENCDSCTAAGFTLEAVRGSNRMVCRTPYVCQNGTEVTSTEGNRPTAAGEENCAECNEGFGEVAQGERTTCQPEFTCPNGTEITETRPAIAMAGAENCASCEPGFEGVMQGERTICQPEYVCPNGTPASGTTTIVGIENCSACDPGFGDLVVVPGSNPQRFLCSRNNPIALWNAGSHDGDFGLDLCQNRINAESVDTIGSNLRSRGYTKAVFFGSTGTGAGDYLFINIGTDTNALALPATVGGSPVSVSDRNIVVFTESGGMVSTMNTFDDDPDDTNPAVARTLGNVTNVADGGGWQNGGADVVGVAGITTSSTRAWSFTRQRAYDSINNCNDATSNSSSERGIPMNSVSVDTATGTGSFSSPCNTMQFVLCVAR